MVSMIDNNLTNGENKMNYSTALKQVEKLNTDSIFNRLNYSQKDKDELIDKNIQIHFEYSDDKLGFIGWDYDKSDFYAFAVPLKVLENSTQQNKNNYSMKFNPKLKRSLLTWKH